MMRAYLIKQAVLIVQGSTREGGMGLLTLQDIFCLGYPDYERTHLLPAHVRKAARAIMQCRTAALGGHVQTCPDEHCTRLWYNSCRHRSCPQCADIQVERWLATQRARLLACDHYHVIFTIPHDLNPLWLGNVSLMTALVFQAVRDTLYALLGDPKYLGAQPGIIAALHTWGQTLVLHPHIHCVVTGGGLTPDGHWKAVRHGFLLPVRVVMAVFRGKLLAALRAAFDRGDLQLPEAMQPQAFLNLLNRLGHPKKTRWNVHIMARYPHGAGVATSLARSLRGGPIKNARLVACDGHPVTFQYTENHATPAGGKGAQQCLTLSLEDFLQRVFLHVPTPHTQVVRYWGLYHPSKAAALVVCRTQMGQPPVAVPERLAWQTVCAQRGDAHPERCPTCGQLLVCTAVIPRGGAPPPARCAERAA